MGLSDRDYHRRTLPPPNTAELFGLRAVKVWSVTTWLIVVCSAVFLIDNFLPVTWVPVSDPYLLTIDGEAIPLPETYVVDGAVAHVRIPIPGPAGTSVEKDMLARPILERAGGNQIGWVEVWGSRPIAAALHHSTARGFIGIQFWRLIGFQFLHADMTHLLMNMLGLFFFGPIVEQWLGSKRYLAFYLLCGIFGALLYTMLNLGGYVVEAIGVNARIPGLLDASPYSPLMGASAGVFGVIIAGAFIAPRERVELLFLIPMRLTTLAYGIVLMALGYLLIGAANAGGHAAHLGGAIAGYYFIRHPKHLHDFFDVLGRVDPTSDHFIGGRGERQGGSRPDSPGTEVDRILDKLKQHGLQSLTPKERRILQEASEQ